MSGTLPTTPTQSGFNTWVQNEMGISTAILPTSSISLLYAFNVALALTPQVLNAVSPLIYTLAVYNLGGDNLINYATDTPPSTYFADLRKSYGVGNFVAGVITSAGDQGTSGSVSVSQSLQNLTLSNLQNLKTPYGRQYLAFCQDIGTVWGVS
jgi:hypothetical protein